MGRFFFLILFGSGCPGVIKETFRGKVFIACIRLGEQTACVKSAASCARQVSFVNMGPHQITYFQTLKTTDSGATEESLVHIYRHVHQMDNVVVECSRRRRLTSEFNTFSELAAFHVSDSGGNVT